MKKYKLKKYEGLKMALYEDYQEGILTKADFDEMKAHWEKISTDSQENMHNLYHKKMEILKKNDGTAKEIHDFLKSQNVLELNRAPLVLLIDKIIIYNKNTIKIKLDYEDEFEKASKRLETQNGSVD